MSNVPFASPALSRLENGHDQNPTLETLWRNAAAAGRRPVVTTEPIPDTRPSATRAKPVKAAPKSLAQEPQKPIQLAFQSDRIGQASSPITHAFAIPQSHFVG
jgi:hypothetical protein